MQLNCPNCQAPIPADNVNITQLVAKCDKCNQLFAFDRQIEQIERHRPEIMLPPGIESYGMLNDLYFEVSWRNGRELPFFIIFTIFWDSIVFLFAVLAILSGQLSMLLFLSLHLAVGIGLLYYTLSLLINKTYVYVNRHSIHIEHKPLPKLFSSTRDIDSKEIKQLFVERYISSKTNGSPNYAFGVEVILKNEERVKLIRGLRTEEQGRYIEQQIERFLHIKDRPVEGEW